MPSPGKVVITISSDEIGNVDGEVVFDPPLVPDDSLGHDGEVPPSHRFAIRAARETALWPLFEAAGMMDGGRDG